MASSSVTTPLATPVGAPRAKKLPLKPSTKPAAKRVKKPAAPKPVAIIRPPAPEWHVSLSVPITDFGPSLLAANDACNRARNVCLVHGGKETGRTSDLGRRNADWKFTSSPAASRAFAQIESLGLVGDLRGTMKSHLEGPSLQVDLF